MVGFFGFGEPGFGVSLGFGYGNIGWVPLAPFERFRPWYGRGYAGRNLALVNNTNIASAYRNARFKGAVTGLRAGDFGRAGVSRSSFVRPGSGELARAGMVSSGMPLAPARNFSGGNTARFNNSSPGFSNSGSPFTNSRSPNVVRLGGAAPNANSGGWRRFDAQPGAPAAGGNRSDVRIFSPQRSAPQPVRISPPIVNNRYEAPPNFRGPGGSPGGFGGPRPNGGPGFGAPPPQQAAPAAPRGYGGGGGFRGAPPSGGGGGGGGPRGNGGGGGGGPRGGGAPRGGGHPQRD